MSCANDTALAALDRGHVTWEQLHPRVRQRLQWDGYDAGNFWCTNAREDHQRALQPGERGRSGNWGNRRR